MDSSGVRRRPSAEALETSPACCSPRSPLLAFSAGAVPLGSPGASRSVSRAESVISSTEDFASADELEPDEELGLEATLPSPRRASPPGSAGRRAARASGVAEDE